MALLFCSSSSLPDCAVAVAALLLDVELLAAAASTITRRFGLDAPQPMAASTDLLGARSQRLVGYLRRAKGGTKECDWLVQTVRLSWKDRLLATSHSQSHTNTVTYNVHHKVSRSPGVLSPANAAQGSFVVHSY